MRKKKTLDYKNQLNIKVNSSEKLWDKKAPKLLKTKITK